MSTHVRMCGNSTCLWIVAKRNMAYVQEAFLAFHSVAAHRPGSSPLNKSTLQFLHCLKGLLTHFLGCVAKDVMVK